MKDISTQHIQYINHIKKWTDIDNMVNQTNLSKYIRYLNHQDKSDTNIERNKSYKENAVFYAFTSYTLSGLVGSAFRKEPVFELPPELEYLDVPTLTRGTTKEVIKKGRAGLFVSFPKVENPSAADVVQANIDLVYAEQLFNWREDKSLIVIRDTTPIYDGFKMIHKEKFRHLAMIDGVFHDIAWVDGSIVSDDVPLNAEGRPWDKIPFCFVGSSNNNSDTDNPPMLDIANINIGHFRNSADFEDSVFYSGQGQPWASGMDENYLRMMAQENVYIGGRNLFPVPAGETFGFATADPNPLARQAMVDKIELAFALGARFVAGGGAAKTATQVDSEDSVASSILSLIVSNVEDAYIEAFGFVGEYMGVDTSSVELTMNREFFSKSATPQEITAATALWLQGAVTRSDMLRYLQNNTDFVDPNKTIEEISEELENETTILDDATE